MLTRGGWRFSMVESGGQYVMTDGVEVKLRWCVECWDIAGNELIVLVCVWGGGGVYFFINGLI